MNPSITYQNTNPSPYDGPAMTLQKILQVLKAGGGGPGGGTQQVFEGRSPAAPDDPALPALNYPVGGGALEQWDGANWV